MTLYVVLLTFAFLAFAIIAWQNFRLTLILLFALLPSYLLRFSIGPIPTTALEIFIFTLCAVALLKFFFSTFSQRARHDASENFSLFTFHFSLLLGAAILATIHAPDTLAALGILKAYYVEPMLVFMLCVTTFKNDEHFFLRIVDALTVSGVVIAIAAIVQYVTNIGIPSPWSVEHRVTSFFDFPNAVGLFLAPIVTLVLVYAFKERNVSRKKNVLMILAATIMLVAIVLAQTEAALVAIPAALMLTILMSPATLRTKIMTAGITGGMFVLLLLFSSTVSDKIFLADLSGNVRLAMWHETATYLHDHWLFGAGLSGFPTAIAPYHDATLFEIFQYPHNILLNIWVELGLFGIIVAAYLFFLLLRTTWRQRNDLVVLSIFAALITMCIHGLVDVPFFKNDLAIMTAGLVAVLVIRKQNKSPTDLHDATTT